MKLMTRRLLMLLAGAAVLAVGATAVILAVRDDAEPVGARMQATDHVVCTSQPFPSAALSAAPIAPESGDAATEAFLEWLDGTGGLALGPYSDQEWRVFYTTDEEAEFGTPMIEGRGGDFEIWSILAHRQGDQWEWNSGGCHLRPHFEGPGGPAIWWPDPDKPLEDDARVIDVLVMERACASGQTAEGRILPPHIERDDATIQVIFHITPSEGSECQGHPPTPYRLDLGEPLDGRALLDGGRTPAAPPLPAPVD